MHNLGLLFDVDGPIASPVTRTINVRSIVTDLVAMAAAGVPIAFITGRSGDFIRNQVVEPLCDAGLGEALEKQGARMFGVFEKGGAWAAITGAGMGEVTVDESVAFSPEAVDAVRALVRERFADTMFFDETKRAMISVEQRTDVDAETYKEAQPRFESAAFDLLTGLGVGLRYGERSTPDASGAVPFRVDPTIISTDIESVLLDKDRGAQRAFEYFAARGPLPRRWRSVGDSRSDYKMADYVHDAGFEVAHVDVRPADGILDRPYDVITIGDRIHDEAGAEFLAHWRRELELE
ncbi:hypothetical protein LLS1_30990 [Leifsonia sp. LS1]|uniref:hypothetical protein n=1 Tax=Leifsonia sp. LS1 TaxID=2828483 RepID=UPI001CFE649C|nr:hypothetical protein [Leifsonia sp. LS1]GIT81430.1 hypothetical protein LLS1_30990 [Leifsonia sp. LS1]